MTTTAPAPTTQPADAPKGLAIGLVGLGAMGLGMGQRLLHAGHGLTIVPHRRRHAADELLAAGAREASAPRELGHCDAVVLCLPSESATEQVLFGEGGIASGGARGTLVLECSTLSPAYGHACARRLADAGLRFADAPVVRGPADAAAGRLHALLGAHEADAPLARRVLSAFCEQVHALGPPGAGYTAKLINAFLVFCNVAAVSEALGTAVAAGIDPRAMLEVVHHGAAQSLAADRVAAAQQEPASGRPRLAIAHPAKDLRYYQALAESLGTQGALASEVTRSLNACEAIAALSRKQHLGEPLADSERAVLQWLDTMAPEQPDAAKTWAGGTLDELLASLRLYHTAAAWTRAHLPAQAP